VSTAAYQAAWRAANPEKVAAQKAAYTKAHPGENAARCATYAKAHREEAKAKKTAHYAANREAEQARSAAYRAANPEKVAAQKAAYYAANTEKFTAYQAAWAKANPEKAAANSAAYRAANPEKRAAYLAAWVRANPERCRAYSALRHARKLGNSIGLPLPDFEAMKAALVEAESDPICYLCGDEQTPIDLSAKWPAPNSLTWEHVLAIINDGPHATENILGAHARCNGIKGKKILDVGISREQIKARKAELDSADARKRLVST
jgi:hypothetical protein